MAGQNKTPVMSLSGEVATLAQPLGAAEVVQNFIRTRDGTLGPVRGPAPLIPDYGAGLPAWGVPHGIFHARLMGGTRDVTLLHHGTSIHVFDGPTRGRVLLVGAPSSGALLETDLPNLDGAQFPTQFLSTPLGIVMMVQGHRPIFYDGERVEYLGFERAPSAPTVWGPSLLSASDTSWVGLITTLHDDFGHGRLGTVSNESGNNTLLRGAYEWATRWKDVWGNLSPIGPRSATMSYPRVVPSPATDPAEYERPLAVVGNIDPGPRHTKGRDVLRTRDLEHKGTTDLFVLPNAAGGNITGGFATVPDNSSQMISDNAPDTWLSISVVDADPMPMVSFGFLAFGRAFYADFSRPGELLYTMPGRYGTPEKDGRILPDPAGGELRGGIAFGGVALVWTATTTFVIEPFQDSSPGFRVFTLSPTVGCVGPSAMTVLGDGSLVWLARDGFYRWTGEGKPQRISDTISRTIESLNAPRLRQAVAAFDPVSREFRCWVAPSGDIENSLCLIFDTEIGSWRRRTGEAPRSVCVTQDHRRYMLAAAYVSAVSGMWVLDHQDHNYTAPTRTYRITTGWLATPDRTTKSTVDLYFREGFAASIALNTYRDYRYGVATDNGKTLNPNQPEDPPAVWGTANFNASGLRWVRRRITAKKVDIYVASATAVQIDLSSTDGQSVPAPWEFVGMAVSGTDLRDAGRMERG